MNESKMLSLLGIQKVSELFSDIPLKVRSDLKMPLGLSEMEVVQRLSNILSKNATTVDTPCFLGTGAYSHYVPSAVGHITSRSEFYTSYTPYQPEISQGMLQSLFEYQSMVCELTAMDAANSSMYDGSTALGEAARMCRRMHKGNRFLIPKALNKDKSNLLENYLIGTGVQILRYEYDPRDGCMSLDDFSTLLKNEVCGAYAELPSFLGVIDPSIMEMKKMMGDIPLVIGVNPLCLGLVRPPGEMGADIVVGEGQPLGSSMNYGGPLLGLFACRQEHVRKMPGRVVGLTADSRGQEAFCLTLQTREQHIRRSTATSNICTNEALNAVAAAVYLSILGTEGLVQLAKRNVERAKRLMNMLGRINLVKSPLFEAYHFNEFAIELPVRPEKVNKLLLRKGIIGGLPLAEHIPELSNCMLLASTEMHSDETQEHLVRALKEVL